MNSSETNAYDAVKQEPRWRRKPTNWQISSVIDGRQLRIQLTAAAMDNIGDEKVQRARVKDLLHGALFRGRMIAQERLRDGADGLDTSRLLAAVQDEVLSALYDYTTTHVFRSSNPTEGEKMAVFAVGGYGRSVLAPSSDIDLLFLRSWKTTAWGESVIEYMLYMLWDMGLKVGHAYRTPEECVRLAKTDLNTWTALLDARFLFGDKKLSDNFLEKFRNELITGNEAKFIEDKLAERDARHIKQGNTRYLVEPNVKEGKGGLRDLQTLYWLVKATYGGETLEDTLKNREIFTGREERVFKRASRFLWTVRCQLHYLTGRNEERLSFDLQPELAERLGYRDRGQLLGVERFMKLYFLVARDVGNLTRVLCARLEADNRKTVSDRLLSLISGFAEKDLHEPGFKVERGRLNIEDEDLFVQDPLKMFKLFMLADEHDLDIHPVALSALTRSLTSFKKAHRESESFRALFLNFLTSANNIGSSLRSMNEAGLLGRISPEFGGIVAQTQFNMYHHFTVDEHTLQAVEVISDIQHERAIEEHALPTKLFPDVENKRALYLAMLLHDTGKGHGDQQIEGAKMALKGAKRLGLPREEGELIAWLVGNHLEMSDCAQKRDITDPRTIADFAEKVGSVERLRLLFILTVADIRAVGPGIWNNWKGQLLSDLYLATASALESGDIEEDQVADEIAQRAESVRDDVKSEVGSIPALLLEMEDAYWAGHDQNELAWHAQILEPEHQHQVAARHRADTGAVELLVSSRDRLGLFADIASALASHNANVASAQIYTGKNGGVLDIFVLHDEEGRPFALGETSRIQRLEKDVLEALKGGGETFSAPKKLERRRAAVFVVDTQIEFDNEGSSEHTILEITTKDRPGLLADLARAIADNKMRLHSAHLGVYGERVTDIFYLQTEEGEKLIDDDVRRGFFQDLSEVMARDVFAAPRTPIRELARSKSAESY